MLQYNEIAQRSKSKLAARLSLLSGAEEFDMAIKCGRCVDDDIIITIDVREHNFEEEKRRIGELITSNFKIIGLKVLLLRLTTPLVEKRRQYFRTFSTMQEGDIFYEVF